MPLPHPLPEGEPAPSAPRPGRRPGPLPGGAGAPAITRPCCTPTACWRARELTVRPCGARCAKCWTGGAGRTPGGGTSRGGHDGRAAWRAGVGGGRPSSWNRRRTRGAPTDTTGSAPNLPVYPPGNGVLLAAVAMMTAGWQGSPEEPAPGFPKKGWSARSEGMVRSL